MDKKRTSGQEPSAQTDIHWPPFRKRAAARMLFGGCRILQTAAEGTGIQLPKVRALTASTRFTVWLLVTRATVFPSTAARQWVPSSR